MCCTGCPAPVWDDVQRVLLFAAGHTYARGLTKTLVADFTPEFSTTVVLKAVPQIKPKKHGRASGNDTDRRITAWANEGQVPPDGSDPRFDYILRVIQDCHWLPVAAQFPVGCEDLRVATKIDLVVTDLQGCLRILEIKCGFDDYFDIANQGHMKYPWTHVPISFRNKSFLQLLVTEYLFRHCQHRLSSRRYGGALLLHVFERDVDGALGHTLEPLPAWCQESHTSEALGQCLEVLKLSRRQTQSQRKRILTNGFRRARHRYECETTDATPHKRPKTQ